LEITLQTYRLLSKVTCASSALLSTYCWAGTSDPIGIGSLLLIGGGIVLGLIFFSFASSKSSIGTVGLILYLIALAIGAWSLHRESELISRQSEEHLREFDERQKRHALAFTEFCKSRHRRILEYAHQKPTARLKPRGQMDRSILIRIDGQLPGGNNNFSASQIASQLRKTAEDCNRTGIKFIEGEYPTAAYTVANSKEDIHRHSACSPIESVVIGESNARYELILGETIEKKQLTRDWENMSSVSVRLVDRRQGKVLAEDQMFFLQHSSGEHGCPEGLPELGTLVLEVFGPAAPY
jgi:hypothetical protein